MAAARGANSPRFATAGCEVAALADGAIVALEEAPRINDVRFKRIVRPDEMIRLEVELTERLADAFFLNAKVSIDGKVGVRFEFACTAAKAISARFTARSRESTRLRTLEKRSRRQTPSGLRRHRGRLAADLVPPTVAR
jgi:hypothetical protein